LIINEFNDQSAAYEQNGDRSLTKNNMYFQLSHASPKKGMHDHMMM